MSPWLRPSPGSHSSNTAAFTGAASSHVRSHALLALALLVGRAEGLYDPVKRLESARLYGNIDQYAYYFVDLIVGTPPQRVSVILDSGSGLAAFPCAGCKHCGAHIDPPFDISKSTTAKWQECGRDKGCTGSCKQGHCSYAQSYLEGSGISGFWFNDYVRLGDAIQRNPPVKARLGCHQNENNLFYTQKANGIFGIEGAQTILLTLFADKKHVNSKVFSVCLAAEGGRFTVGGFNQSYHTAPVQYVPQLSSKYILNMVSIKINGKTVSTLKTSGRSGNAMVDSGTTYTYFSSRQYRDLHGAIINHCKKTGCSSSGSDCWNVPNADMGKFPIVDMGFADGVTVKWNPREYMFRRGQSSRWCFAFKDDGARPMQTLGASFMLYKEVVFDLESRRIGFAPANCPSHKVPRPKHITDAKLLESPVAGPPKEPPPLVTVPTTMVAAPAATIAPTSVTQRTNIAPTPVAPPTTMAPTSATARPGAGHHEHNQEHQHKHDHPTTVPDKHQLGQQPELRGQGGASTAAPSRKPKGAGMGLLVILAVVLLSFCFTCAFVWGISRHRVTEKPAAEVPSAVSQELEDKKGPDAEVVGTILPKDEGDEDENEGLLQ